MTKLQKALKALDADPAFRDFMIAPSDMEMARRLADVPVMPDERDDDKTDIEALQLRIVGLPTWEPIIDPDDDDEDELND